MFTVQVAIANPVKEESRAEDETDECERKNEVDFKARKRKDKRALNSFKSLNINYRKNFKKTGKILLYLSNTT